MKTRRSKIIAIAGGVVVVAIIAWLAFGFFGIQAAFTDKEVQEAGPVFTSSSSQEADDEVQTLAQGDFQGKKKYTVTGQAVVIGNGTDQRFLRLENFESTNGPDLYVYLRAADDSFVDLGLLKGNTGDQNYEIPSDVDLDKYSTVDIWCKRFGVGFGDAKLAAEQ